MEAQEVSQVLRPFHLPKPFVALMTKVKVNEDGSAYLLMQELGAQSDVLVSTLLKVPSAQTEPIEIAKSDQNSVIIDFYARNGQLVLLKSRMAEGLYGRNFVTDYRELVIEKFISDRLVQSKLFFDSNQEKAIYYDGNKQPQPVRVKDPKRTLYFKPVELVDYARVYIATNGQVFLTVSSDIGNKLYSLSDKLEVHWDLLIKPFVASYFQLYDKAPWISETEEGLSVATEAIHDQLDILKTGSAATKVSGNFSQGVLFEDVSWSGAVLSRSIHFLADQLYLQNFQTKDHRKVLLGTRSDDQGSKGILVLFSKESQSPSFQIDLRPKNESYFTELAFFSDGNSTDGILVGGKCGFKQVSTGSIVEPADACLMKLDSNGNILSTRTFGTTRNDAVTALDVSGERALIGGVINGPITHTADQDPSQGYQEAFAGWFDLR